MSEMETETFEFDGEEPQVWDTSDIYSEVTFELYGAGGGRGGDNGYTGNPGGYIKATISVDDYDELEIYVADGGKEGSDSDDGYGGWGRVDGDDGDYVGGFSSGSGGGGGGLTTVTAPDGTDLLKAGGGSGGSHDWLADANGGDGADDEVGGGGDGTAVANAGHDVEIIEGGGNDGTFGDGESATVEAEYEPGPPTATADTLTVETSTNVVFEADNVPDDYLSVTNTTSWQNQTSSKDELEIVDGSLQAVDSVERDFNEDPNDNGDKLLADGDWYDSEPSGYAHDNDFTHDNEPFEDGEIREYTFSEQGSGAELNIWIRDSEKDSADGDGDTGSTVLESIPDTLTVEVEYTDGTIYVRDEDGSTLYSTPHSGDAYISWYEWAGSSGTSSLRLTDVVEPISGEQQWKSILWNPDVDDAVIQSLDVTATEGEDAIGVRVQGYDSDGAAIDDEDTGFVSLDNTSQAEELSANQFRVSFEVDTEIASEATIDSYTLTTEQDGVSVSPSVTPASATSTPTEVSVSTQSAPAVEPTAASATTTLQSVTTTAMSETTPAVAETTTSTIRRIITETASGVPLSTTPETTQAVGEATSAPATTHAEAVAAPTQASVSVGTTAQATRTIASSTLDAATVASTAAPVTTDVTAVSALTEAETVSTVTPTTTVATGDSTLSTATVSHATVAAATAPTVASGTPTQPSVIAEAPPPDTDYFYYVSNNNTIRQYNSDGTYDVVANFDDEIVGTFYHSASNSFGTTAVTYSDKILAYDSSGSLILDRTEFSDILAVTIDDSYIYHVRFGGNVSAYDAESGGSEFWDSSVSDRTEGMTPNGEGDVYVTSEYAVELATESFSTTIDSFDEHKDDVTAPVRNPGSQLITLCADGELRQYDGTESGTDPIQTDSSRAFSPTVDPKTDKSGAIYLAINDDGSWSVARYTWENGIEWETSVDYDIESIDVSVNGNVYVDEAADQIRVYDADDGSLLDEIGGGIVGDIHFFPDYPHNEHAWDRMETRASVPAQGATATSNTPTASGSAFTSASGGGTTATTSSTTAVGMVGASPTTSPAVATSSTTPSSATTHAASGVESDLVATATPSVPTVDRRVDATATPVETTSATPPSDVESTASPATTPASASTTQSTASGTRIGAPVVEPLTQTTTVGTPSVTSQVASDVESLEASVSPSTAVGNRRVSAMSSPTAAEVILSPVSVFPDTARAITTVATTSFSTPSVETDASVDGVETVATGIPATAAAETTTSATGSGVTTIPEVNPTTAETVANADSIPVSATPTLPDLLTETRATPQTTPANVSTVVPEPSVKSSASPQTAPAEATTISSVVDGSVGVSVAVQSTRAVATPSIAFQFDPRLARPTTGSNRMQSRDASNRVSLRSSRNQVDVSGGSNNVTLDVSANEIDVDADRASDDDD